MNLARVTLIGTGNVSYHLYHHLAANGSEITHIYGRSANSIRSWPNKPLKTTSYRTSLNFQEAKSDLFIIAVSDQAIASVGAELKTPENAIIVHTSGSIPLDALRKHPYHGVFYPLQTFSMHRNLQLNGVPVFIESVNSHVQRKLFSFAGAQHFKPYQLNSNYRQKLHLAAVFASNFTNHQITIAAKILKAEGLSFELLKPLLIETMNKIIEQGPEGSLTGPAKRNDLNIVKSHMEALADDPSRQEIYKAITNDILKMYSS